MMTMKEETLFKGPANLYLEGEKTLNPSDWLSLECVTYYLGTPESKIQIFDHRSRVNEMAIRSIEQRGYGWSPQIFCEPSNATVKLIGEKIQILLYPSNYQQSESPVLWFGISVEEEVSSNPVRWIRHRDSGDGRTSFVALLEPEPAYGVR